MPEIVLSESMLRAAGITSGGRPITLDRIGRAVPEILSPRQIVAGLHRQIAGLSPSHAELVRQFEALPRPDEPQWDAGEEASAKHARSQVARRDRLAEYAELRKSMSREEAGNWMGLKWRTTYDYEQDCRAGNWPVSDG
jgi:hypothetical protein